jgi:hypothetical protein
MLSKVAQWCGGELQVVVALLLVLQRAQYTFAKPGHPVHLSRSVGGLRMFSELVNIDSYLTPYLKCAGINDMCCWRPLCAWSSFNNANGETQFMGE